ncbi:MAG: peptidoglycan DD-metalloendopeptidase family protein [Candidatus Peribacter sp.]|jgi:murein DD-endopeptidase MepM/ murein hydrolase activator NlpD|nr:peptidoglycan DD-metalloendopeptidase family protein [Candidatus Peribacter sp.]MBT4393410.1 peptidoglycan DD-metalloendopeptidase family protein [Candidatus Peribacter sp.]MBT4600751.1 peptidoglycan DD-metalloendopeptidase family protein [Candidatus Peribacter sp.]MBT5149203.1 peptidoglycan DD-metalloendopeptidase family protein [Candidatus Peribacter sp.]MBT5637824.1 peptidoglycan DD-metalloendopeptidase family protein [Candidatus Peribacter sp.]
MHLHIIHRLPVVAAALFVAVLITGAQMTASLVARDETAVQFDGMVEQAEYQKYHGRTVLRDRRMQQAHKTKVANRLHTIEVERRRLQREMRNMQEQESLHGSAEENAVELSQQLTKQRFSQSLSANKAKRLLQRMVYRAGVFSAAPTKSALSLAEHVLSLRHQDQRLSKQQSLVEADVARNEDRVRASTEQLAAARQMMKHTQEVIAALQSHLARIDAQITRRQERRGVIDGELDAQHNKYAEAIGDAFALFWPAKARITAGFRDRSYQKFFGIPHKGIDIAIPQGTPVKSAADGVVYLARDAGMGFSYVLVGHKEGYATLYGHLSEIHVATGDSVEAGQVIGKSGGAKGTRGAGLVTTGAHLHFELIHNGTHIDSLPLFSDE